MTVPTISNLPTVPATSDPNFETEAPALFNHIKNTFVSEMNSAISFINSSTFDATVEFKNADFTAARNFLYMIDTSSGGVSVTLPANPSTGDQLLLMDQKRTFGTNNLTIGRNSQNINGAASDVVSKSTGALIRCIFQSSYGWTVDLYEGEWESGTNAGDLVYNGGNVGIGTSSPDSTLHVVGTNSGDDLVALNLTNKDTTAGTATAIRFTNSTTENFLGGEIAVERQSDDSNDLRINLKNADSTATYPRMLTIDGSTGNVGIGTSSPSGDLHIESDSTSATQLIMKNTATGGKEYHLNCTADSSSIGGGKFALRDATANAYRMTIDSSGNVGIGTSAPAAGTLLHVQGVIGTTNGTAAAPTHSFYGDPDNGMYRSAVNELSFSTAGTQRLTIDSAGNVGVGTSAPAQPLHVLKANGAAYGVFDSYREAQFGGGINIAHARGTQSSPDFLDTNDYLGLCSFGGWQGSGFARYAEVHALATQNHTSTAGGTKLILQTTANDTISKQNRLVIDQNGNVGINENSPDAKLDIGIGASNADGLLVTSSNDALVTGDHIKAVSGRGSTDAYNLLNLENAAGTQMIVQGDGNVGIGTNSPSAKLTVNKGDDIGFIVQDNTTDNHRLHMMTSASDNGYYIGYASGQSEGYKLNSSGDSYFLGGDVGIGTNSPGAELDVRGALSDTAGGFQFGMGSSTASYFGVRLDTSGNVCFDTYGAPWTERMKIERTTGNVEVKTGNLVIGTAGKGIDFGVASGSVTSQLLDDYEEGTFTPTYSTTDIQFSAINYDTQNGSYTKIGRQVFFTLRLQTSSITVGSANGTIRIGGLPFTPSSTSEIGRSAVHMTQCTGFAGDVPSSAFVFENQTYLYLRYRATSNGDDLGLAVSDMGTGSNSNQITLSGSYQV